MSGVAPKVPNVQYAALPWRESNGELQVLLVTSLTTKRWIVPKGWPVAGLSPTDCVAHEAEEEAGVMGEVLSEPIGTFHYDKRRKSGDTLRCRVEVFALKVTRQRRTWPEKSSREIRWCSPEEAASRVADPGLRRLIGRFKVQFD